MRWPSFQLTIGVLGGAFTIEFLWLGISPASRSAWVLENLLVVALAVALLLSWRSFRLSRLSYILILAFLAVHEVGAHHTYSEVPYEEGWHALVGGSLNERMGWERNHFDRLVHLLYGLLLTYPIREFYLRVVSVRGIWGYLLPLGFVMATSMVYELLEWAAALTFGGDVAHDFVGAQGDIWDAQVDMALASLGAAIAMLATLAVNVALQRDFAAEWAESLRVKGVEPLGEEAVARMLKEQGERAEP
ncbi:MAG: putative membrane protein [Planctomycetota bacterium]|jgi:putative membrane protein